jgi:hypothetical protein
MDIVWILLVGSNSQSSTTKSVISCMRDVNKTLVFSCPTGATIETFDIDNLTTVNTIEKLQVIGSNGNRGPLTFIPENICDLTQLTVNMT